MFTMASMPLTDTEKSLLIKRYLDLKFVDDVKQYVCARCDRVALVHYFSNCNHAFCRNCKNILEIDKGWKCPCCRTPILQLSRQDFFFERRMYQLKTHCPNMKYGCTYVDELKNLPNHILNCKETLENNLPVPYTGDNFDVVDSNSKVEEMEKKIKQIETELVESKKRETQLMEKVTQLEHNMAEKPKLSPDDSKFGDKMNMVVLEQLVMKVLDRKRYNQAENIDDQKNFNQNIVARNSWWNQGTQHWDSKFNFTNFEWTLNDFKSQIMPGTPVQFCSDEFPLKGYPFGAALEMVVDHDKILVLLIFKDINRRGMSAFETHPSKFICIVVDVNDSSCDAVRNSSVPIVVDIKAFDKIHQILKFQFPKSLMCLNEQRYFSNGSITIKLVAESPVSIDQSEVLNNGTFIWHIDDYSLKKKQTSMGFIDYIVSPSFYTEPFGRLFGLRLNLGGHGPLLGRGISAKIVFFPGQWDKHFPNSFGYVISVAIMDQSMHMQRGHIIECWEFTDIDVADIDIANYCLFENPEHLKDDRLVLKVIFKKGAKLESEPTGKSKTSGNFMNKFGAGKSEHEANTTTGKPKKGNFIMTLSRSKSIVGLNKEFN